MQPDQNNTPQPEVPHQPGQMFSPTQPDPHLPQIPADIIVSSPTPPTQPSVGVIAQTAYTPPAPLKKKRKLLLPLVVLAVLLIGGALFMMKSKDKPAASQADKNTQASSAVALDELGIVQAFVKAIQDGRKAEADTYISDKMKVQLKTTLNSESYAEYCASDKFCGSLTWFDLTKATNTKTDTTTFDGRAAKLLTLTVTTDEEGSHSENTLKFTLTQQKDSWVIEDIDMGFKSSS